MPFLGGVGLERAHGHICRHGRIAGCSAAGRHADVPALISKGIATDLADGNQGAASRVLAEVGSEPGGR